MLRRIRYNVFLLALIVKFMYKNTSFLAISINFVKKVSGGRNGQQQDQGSMCRTITGSPKEGHMVT